MQGAAGRDIVVPFVYVQLFRANFLILVKIRGESARWIASIAAVVIVVVVSWSWNRGCGNWEGKWMQCYWSMN